MQIFVKYMKKSSFLKTNLSAYFGVKIVKLT